MDRLFAAVSMIQGNQGQRFGQGAGVFAVGSSMNPFSMGFFYPDTGKVPPNRKLP